MVDVTLTIYSLDDARKLPLTSDRVSIGRGDNADLPIDDKGLSRVHATIYREGDRVWILDDASTNGTCVNNVPVPPTGSPLADGDEITAGDDTTILVHIREAKNPPLAIGAGTKTTNARPWTLPLMIAAGGVAVVLATAVVIASYTAKSKTTGDPVQSLPQYRARETPSGKSAEEQAIKSSSPDLDPSPLPNVGLSDGQEPALSGIVPGKPIAISKTYASMTKEEQTSFVAQEAQHVARMIGNREGFAFTPEVVRQIKIWVDAYAHRLKGRPPNGGCNMHHDLSTLLTRAAHHAPLVTRSFNEKGLSPQVGLYLAMIESEYCPCLSSGTGAKGMFQFVGTTARRYGVKDVSQPSTDRRADDRCKVEIMAPIAAQYMKDLVATYGTGPLSVPLAIASYNSGEGGLSGNLNKTLNSVRGSERSFWSLVADSSQLSSQFQKENIKYVPHFFGAAIVGENPRVFGVDMPPLSTHTVSENTATDGTP
jgi:pSer/pThr/pTyr-binding forkhead associated (FHA) protein